MLNILVAIATTAGFVLVMVGIIAFINTFFGTRIGLSGSAIPADTVIGTICIVLGGLFLFAPLVLRKLFGRNH